MDVIGELKFHGRFIDIYGEADHPLFLAVDVARMIDYSVGHTSHMLETVDDEEKILKNVPTRRNGANGAHNTRKWFLTEDGLYEVLFQSRKPVAKQFKTAVKQILRDLREEKGETIEQSFSRMELLADEKGLADLREDIRGY